MAPMAPQAPPPPVACARCSASCGTSRRCTRRCGRSWSRGRGSWAWRGRCAPAPRLRVEGRGFPQRKRRHLSHRFFLGGFWGPLHKSTGKKGYQLILSSLLESGGPRRVEMERTRVGQGLGGLSCWFLLSFSSGALHAVPSFSERPVSWFGGFGGKVGGSQFLALTLEKSTCRMNRCWSPQSMPSKTAPSHY